MPPTLVEPRPSVRQQDQDQAHTLSAWAPKSLQWAQAGCALRARGSYAGKSTAEFASALLSTLSMSLLPVMTADAALSALSNALGHGYLQCKSCIIIKAFQFFGNDQCSAQRTCSCLERSWHWNTRTVQGCHEGLHPVFVDRVAW